MISIRRIAPLLIVGAAICLAIQAYISFSLEASCGCKHNTNPGAQRIQAASGLAQANCDTNTTTTTIRKQSALQIDSGNAQQQQPKILTADDVEPPEFPFRLTCPGQVLKKTNYSLVMGYHIGMLRNWKTVLRDQMHTLQECGLGAALDKWFISYSGKGADDPEAASQIKQVLNEFPKLQTHMSYQLFQSRGVPWEGVIMNTLREYCHEQSKLGVEKTRPTVVFYWHTKGTSRWKAKWRQQMEEPYTYSRVLYWRKYMEYFLMERPAHCIHKIRNENALTCGVNRFANRGVYGGNFWASSCQYLRKLPALTIKPPQNKKSSSGYFDAEDLFGKYQNDSNPRSETFVSLHQPPRMGAKNSGFYYRLIEPAEYASTISNWGPDV